jgi:hypothetical protein
VQVAGLYYILLISTGLMAILLAAHWARTQPGGPGGVWRRLVGGARVTPGADGGGWSAGTSEAGGVSEGGELGGIKLQGAVASSSSAGGSGPSTLEGAWAKVQFARQNGAR